jgi:hypothetical protein
MATHVAHQFGLGTKFSRQQAEFRQLERDKLQRDLAHAESLAVYEAMIRIELQHPVSGTTPLQLYQSDGVPA